jgi:hypothetical protein
MMLLGVGVLTWAVSKYINGWIPRGEIMTTI